MWREFAGQSWSNWDLWFGVVCLVDHGGDWEAMGAALDARGHLHERDSEAKRSHVDDLIGRLRRAGVDLTELIGSDVDQLVLRQKARTKVLRQELMARDLTEPMRYTPRVRLRAHALRGHWERFPVSPSRFDDGLQDEIEDRPFYGERAAMGLARRLERFVQRSQRQIARRPPEQLALRRALLTAGNEAILRADDSCGKLGELLADGWRAYARTAWQATGMDPDTYYRDLCGMVVWDDFCSLYRIEELPFQAVRPDHVDRVEHLLQELADQLDQARLVHHAREAHENRAWLAIAHRRLDRFEPIAAALGSDNWIVIDRMARLAVEDGNAGPAAAVFDAADQPGSGRDHLQNLRRELIGSSRAARPRHLTVLS